MTSKRQKRIPQDVAVHIFQRASHGFVVFYNSKDSLVFFTMFSVLAVRHRLRVIGLCIMHNHIHILTEMASNGKVSAFERDLISWFTRVYNARHGFVGKLFDTYGISLKRDDKAVRTALAYVNNNPVEGRMCRRAEEWRWNFIAFAESTHPYSEKMTLSLASRGLRRAARMIEYFRSAGKPLLYERLDELLDPLSVNEKRQMIDFIIREYSIIDFPRAVSFYGSYRAMVEAFSLNTGSEYDLREPFDPNSGQAYWKMTRHFAADRRFNDIGDLLGRPAEAVIDYFNELVTRCLVSPTHAKKFLRIQDAEDSTFTFPLK